MKIEDLAPQIPQVKRRWVSSLILCVLGLFSALLLIGCEKPAPPQGLTVNVERVVSGQTLEVAGTSGTFERVRLIGVEAPDLKQQPWGMEAAKRLEEMIQGQPVLLEFDVEEKYCYKERCTQLAYVWQNGQMLNEQLAKAGSVLALPRSPNSKYTERLAHAQEWARLMGLGIWNPENPMRLTPAEFRSQNQS